MIEYKPLTNESNKEGKEKKGKERNEREQPAHERKMTIRAMQLLLKLIKTTKYYLLATPFKWRVTFLVLCKVVVSLYLRRAKRVAEIRSKYIIADACGVKTHNNPQCGAARTTKVVPFIRKNDSSTAVKSCDTLFGSAPAAIMASGFACPSDFLEQQRAKHGGVFRFPLVPGWSFAGKLDLAPVFVLDMHALAQLKPSNGFGRTNIAEDALTSNVGLPMPSIDLKDAANDEVLYKVFRTLVSKRAVQVRDQLFHTAPKAVEKVLNGGTHYNDLYHVAARSMFMSMGGALVCEEFVASPEMYELFIEYSQNFTKVFVLQKLGLNWAAESMRKPLFSLIERLETLQNSFASQDDFLNSLQPFTKDLRDATLGPLGQRFGVNTEKHKLAYWGVLPLFGALLNSAATLYWLLHGVLADPEAKKAIFSEIREKCAGRPCGAVLQEIAQEKGMWKGLKEDFPKLNSALYEASRMCSAVMIMFRATRDTEIKAYKDQHTGEMRGPLEIQEGQLLVSNTLNAHFDETIFENPTTFQWDRFMPCPKTGRAKEYTTKDGARVGVMSWGHGSSICPGKRIALDALMSVAISLFSQYDVEIAPGSETPQLNMAEWGIGAMTPDRPVPIIVNKI